MGSTAQVSGGQAPGGQAAGGGTSLAEQVVGAAIWAPSVHNTQPWWFSATDQAIRLYADRGRQLTVADPDGREMLISCGAALFTARLALRALGYLPETDILPDPAEPLLAATVTWPGRHPPTRYEQQLFGQVRNRRTHRGGFDPLPLSARLLAVLAEGAARDGAALQVITDAAGRALASAAVRAAEDLLHADAAYMQELAVWVPPPGSRRDDGVPDSAYPVHREHTVPDFPGRDFSHGRRWGKPGFGSPGSHRSAGVICLLTTAGDGPEDWLGAGQALQRIALTSATCGVAAALHSQPVELPGPRELLRTQLCPGGGYPQLVLRLGTVIQTEESVRRPVASVLRVSPAGRGAQTAS